MESSENRKTEKGSENKKCFKTRFSLERSERFEFRDMIKAQ